MRRSAGYSMQLFVFGSPHEIESKASRGRYAQAHHPSLRLGGDRRLLLILP